MGASCLLPQVPPPILPQGTKHPPHHPSPTSVATVFPDCWDHKDFPDHLSPTLLLSLQTLVESFTKGNGQVLNFSSFLLAPDFWNWALEAHRILSIQTSDHLSSHWDRGA